MTINRLTRKRLYEDEAVFNNLLPYAKYDPEFGIFVHSDASLWSIWELTPQSITSTSDSDAFQLCTRMQEMIDSIDHNISLQFNWINTFDIEGLLQDNLTRYPVRGAAGWMARRWVRSLKRYSQSHAFHRRPRKMRLVVSFRYDPPWRARGALQQLLRTLTLIFKGQAGVSANERRSEYLDYANRFKGTIDGSVAKLNDLGFRPRRVDGQGLINLLYPLLNRRSIKGGTFRKGRYSGIAVPEFDRSDFIVNQVSDTPIEHPADGLIKKDGRVFRSISMVKAPKQCLPLMIAPLLASPYEHIVTVTLSKDPKEAQLARLDRLDSTLGFRERTGLGRLNQKISHQISVVRAARQELYNGNAQLVRVGVHQTFICQNEDEAIRAASEGIATFPQLNGSRGMIHEISDLGMLVNTLPGAYDPETDGPGWTNMMRSSRAVRLLPLWGNWKGSQGSQYVLPSLWNRELVGFDFFDSSVAPNVLVSGVSGAGKSYLLCYLLIGLNRGHFATSIEGKKVERQPITFIFDKGMTGQPCGFDKLARMFGGRIYEATPSKAPPMNFLARLGRTPPDSRNEDYKDLIDMCTDIIGDMASEGSRTLDRLERACVIDSLLEAHQVYRAGPMKREFILSDVVSILRAPQRVGEDEETAKRRQKISVLIGDYYGEGNYARFFDRPGGLTLKERFIVFDLKSLSRNPDLQRVFLKVAMLWADTVMNDPSELDTRKVLVFDEAHDLIGKTSANTIETAFRLYRKRKGIVIAASQSGEDFYVGSGGQAIVQNSAHKIFLRQDPSKFHMTAQAFNLSQQQSDVILRLRTVSGVESQFYMISDIGEGALVLPMEPAYYWVSTNNGDDNQLFHDLMQRCNGNFMAALELAIRMAPAGSKILQLQRQMAAQATGEATDSASSGQSLAGAALSPLMESAGLGADSGATGQRE